MDLTQEGYLHLYLGVMYSIYREWLRLLAEESPGLGVRRTVGYEWV